MPLVKRNNSQFWYVQFQIDHQTVVRSTKTTDRRLAEKVESKLRSDLISSKYLKRKASITLGDALDKFIETKCGTPNHRNLVSQRRVVCSLISSTTPLARLDSAALERLRVAQVAAGLSGQTIKHRIALITRAIKSAKKQGFDAPEIEAPVVRLPRSRLRYLTVQEESRLLAELGPVTYRNGLSHALSDVRLQQLQDNFDLVVLLLDTGARHTEIASLEWSQVDLAAGTVRLWRPKVQNESILYLTERALRVMHRRHLSKSSRFVFSSRDSGPRKYSVVAIRKAFKRAGLVDCTLHTLRHTHASRLIQMGMSIYEVRKILGHTDIKTTMRYAHLEEVDVMSRARDLINRLNQESAVTGRR